MDNPSPSAVCDHAPGNEIVLNSFWLLSINPRAVVTMLAHRAWQVYLGQLGGGRGCRYSLVSRKFGTGVMRGTVGVHWRRIVSKERGTGVQQLLGSDSLEYERGE